MAVLVLLSLTSMRTVMVMVDHGVYVFVSECMSCVCVCGRHNPDSDTVELCPCLSEGHSHCTPVLHRLSNNVGTCFNKFR